MFEEDTVLTRAVRHYRLENDAIRSLKGRKNVNVWIRAAIIRHEAVRDDVQVIIQLADASLFEALSTEEELVGLLDFLKWGDVPQDAAEGLDRQLTAVRTDISLMLEMING